jgi:outer membrane protein
MKFKIVRSLLMVIAVCAFTITSFSQEKKVLSLPDAIDLSIKNSKQLKLNTAKIKEASGAVQEALDRQLPDVTASGSYLRLTNAKVDMKTKTTSSSSGGSTGGTSSGSGGKVNQAAYGILNASLPLYAGGRIKYGIESSKFLEQATKLDAENDKDKVVLNTLEAYDNLYKAKSAVQLVQASLEGARQRVTQFANLEKNGVLARNDYLKAQLQASNTELGLLDAENNWKLANINMDLMLGLPETTELITDSTNWTSALPLKNVEDYVQEGLQKRKDLEALSYRRRAAETGIKAVAAEKYPSLALTGGYVALDVPNAIAIYNAANIGLGVQYSLSSLWKNKAKVDQAKAREEGVVASEEMLADAIRLQVYQAYQNYLSQVKKIDVYSVAVAQAEENYKILQNKYNNGLATVTDLLDADVARLQANLNLANAKSDAAVGYNRILQTAGVLEIK